jgi:hypothetical protein
MESLANNDTNVELSYNKSPMWDVNTRKLNKDYIGILCTASVQLLGKYKLF